jgi:hypothetical protein
MQCERLRDSNENWGLSPTEYAQREKTRLRERMKKRLQRARIKVMPPPMLREQLVEKHTMFRLKGQDIQELGIIAVVASMVKRQNPIARWREPILVPMSLPFVSLLHGEKQC